MRISLDKNNYTPSMKAGLYFSKYSNVLFNKDPKVNYLTDEIVKFSEKGSRYIEDTEISQKMKNKFAKIPFIKKLAEKFDTFVHFSEISREFNNVSYARVSWADYSKSGAEYREFVGVSNVSKEKATKEMFKKMFK